MAETDARRSAWIVLNRLNSGNKTLDRVLDEYFAGKDILPKRERSLFYALVYGVLRWRGRLDWIISHFSKTPVHKIDPQVLNLLRLGLFQITGLDKVPASAAVNTTVEMAKSLAAPWLARFVNANLRKMAREHQNVPFPEIESQAAPALAAIKSFPEWLLQRWLRRFGLNETMALCDAVNTIPPITLRTNTLKSDRPRLVASLAKDAAEIWTTAHAPDGVCLGHLKKNIAEMKSFKQGWFQVQDEGAQLVALLLNPRPGERVLDACAGLGGKTGHIAQLMKNRGEIMAVDMDNRKLQRISHEMSRLGVAIVKTRRHDLSVAFSREEVGMFDRILVDAPCSGLGVIRRNPDSKWFSSENDLKRLGARQLQFLENLGARVKPAGVMAFTVCSTETEENEDVIKAFLKNHADFVIDNRPGGLPHGARGSLDPNGYFRTFPHINGMDGFFSVRLRRIT